jgi:amino acid adenylation domain-containing protein
MSDDVLVFPVSFAQQRLWFLEQLSPGNASYNIAGALRLQARLDLETLDEALREIARRHEILRTTFTTNEAGEPVQIIASEPHLGLAVQNLAELDEPEREAEAIRLATVEARLPFDLERGPLLRAKLLLLGGSESVFLLSMHHIVSDGWSLGVLFDELGAIYQAFAAGEDSPLAELPIQYADYVVWQREMLQGELLNNRLSYWKEQLAGCPILALPADHPRPAIATHRGATYPIELNDSLAKALKEFSRREGVTLFMTLLAAFKVLLRRYTGQEDIVVGIPVAGRDRTELEGMIGFFVNTLVLRTDYSGTRSFREALRRVRDVALGAYTHADLPFEKLVAELQIERSLSRNPVFQVAFQLFQEAPGWRGAEPDRPSRHLEIEKGTTIFDLSLFLWEGGGHVRGRLEYSTDLFDRSTILRMAGHFQTLLSGIVANADLPVTRLPLLTEAEKIQLLQTWGRGPAESFEVVCVHQLFETCARERPDALAVAQGALRMSYGELNRRANQVSHHLRRLGIGPEATVGLCLDRSIFLVVGALGVMKSGGNYLSLDPGSPLDRLGFMLADASVSVVLTATQWVDRVPQGGWQVLCLDRWPAEIANGEATNPTVAISPNNLAYIIYTSGSTGRPKGVLIPHAGLSNLVRWHVSAYGVSADDRATLLANPAFDASVWELWPYLASGASLHIPDAALRESPSNLVQWLASENITLTFLPTPLAELVLDEPCAPELSLRAVLTGGDRLRRGPRKRLPFRFINHYGPTENSVVTSCGDLGPWTEGDPPPPIGRPIANVQVYVLDACLQPVPIGVPGELYIGGIGLARGYLSNSELTAEKFLANPFGDQPGSRLYRTGDRVRYRPDGNLEFLGRLDHQVKIRGFRIEPGEVEAVIKRHPGVQEAIVLGWEQTAGDGRLVAYVVLKSIDSESGSGTTGDRTGLLDHPDPSDQATPAEEEAPLLDGIPSREKLETMTELRLHAGRHLPEYMVPWLFVILPSLPVTAHGKVDRAALPVPEVQRPAIRTKYVGPRNSTEQLLAELWAAVLGLDRVGIEDHFFKDLGGHSLLTTRVISRVRSLFGIELALRALFEAPTISALADRVETLRWAAGRRDPGVFEGEREEGAL